MNYSKLILVGCISAFVAFTTSIMGVAGTIIGSVISSVLYNMLSEVLEKPVQEAAFSADFEWEIAYIFPLVVIVLIQLLFIMALLSEWGFLPYGFLNAYLSLQGVAGNNLYRVLGFALIVMSIYPLILKPDFIKKEHGVVIAFVGIIFLARGFVDMGNAITDIYDGVFRYFDFPIAIIALILLISVILKILVSARESESEFKIIKKKMEDKPVSHNTRQVHTNKKHYSRRPEVTHNNVKFKNHVHEKESANSINKSSGNIQFESNDLLDDYKK